MSASWVVENGHVVESISRDWIGVGFGAAAIALAVRNVVKTPRAGTVPAIALAVPAFVLGILGTAYALGVLWPPHA